MKRWRRAIPYLERARILFRADENPDGEGCSLCGISTCYWNLRNRRLANQLAIRALFIVRNGSENSIRYVLDTLAGMMFLSKRWHHSESLYSRLAQYEQRSGQIDGELIALCAAAVSAMKRRRYIAADRNCAEAEKLLPEANSEAKLCWIQSKSWILSKTDNRKEVRKFLDYQTIEGFDLMQEARFLVLRVRRGGEIGRLPDALTAVVKALRAEIAKVE